MKYSLTIVHDLDEPAKAKAASLRYLGRPPSETRLWALFWDSDYDVKHEGEANLQTIWTDTQRERLLPIVDSIAEIAYGRRSAHGKVSYIEGMGGSFDFDDGSLRAYRFRHAQDRDMRLVRTWLEYHTFE